MCFWNIQEGGFVMHRSHPVVQITLSRLKEFYREPGALFWVFGFPVLMAVVLGIAFANRPPAKPKVILVRTANAAWIEEALDPERVDLSTMDRAEADIALRKGAADAALISRAPDEVTYLFDSTREESRIARLVVDDALQRGRGRRDPVLTEDETPSIRGSRYIDFLIPGILGLNIMGSSMWGVGYSIVHARKHRVLRRLAATPMRRSHYLLGYVLFRLIFLVWEITALLIFAYAAFDVVVQGSLLAVAALVVLGAMGFVGLGLLVASRTESLEAASGWMNFLMLPSWLLSGTFFSYLRFPEFLHPFIKLLPLTALNDGVRSVFNEAAGFTDVVPQLMVLAGWAVVSFVVALRIFKWQ